MKIVCVLAAVVLLATANAQDEAVTKGVIYGVVQNQQGEPARDIGLTALPVGVALGGVLPHTRTDKDGRYRFVVAWWGRYTVFADDVDAGYSNFSTGPSRQREVREVTLSPEHPQAEFNLVLPPKTGFIEIHLRNRRTGERIRGLGVTLMSADAPETFLYTESCDSIRPILVPPEKALLLHIQSPGFREWTKSTGRGFPIRLTSGEHLILDVELDPMP